MHGMIFDVDGTLCDTLGIWQGLGARYLDNRGILCDPDLDDRVKHMGMHRSAEYIKSTYGISDSVTCILRSWREMIDDFYRYDATVKDGVLPYLEELKRRHIPCAVATVNSCELIDALFHRLDIRQYFDVMYCGLDEKCGKDTPLLYLKAARAIQTDISRTWVFEDNHQAARIAHQAGFPVLGMWDNHHAQTDKQALCKVTQATFDDFHQALAWLKMQPF